MDDQSVEAFWKTYDELEEAIARAGRGNLDVSAEQAARNVTGRWKDTAEFVIGPWSMGKDLDSFSALDWWNSADGVDYFCNRGYGALVAHYGRDLKVSLNTEVNRIDWSEGLVKVDASNGTVEAKTVIVTVSTGVLASGLIKFAPRLPADTRQAFASVSMGYYDHIAIKFSKDVFGVGENGYLLHEIGNDGAGFGTLANADGNGLAYCDVGGSWAEQLLGESVEYKVDYALNQLKSMLGNGIVRHFEKATATAWGLERTTMGSYASAEPGAYHLRRRLRQPIAEKVFFAGEACHRTMWATVGGAHLSGVEAARSVLHAIG